MRRFRVFILLALLSTAFATPGHAVHLQQGWYAMFGGVYVEGFDPSTGQPYSESWYPATGLGELDPLHITLWHNYTDSRVATVAYDADISPGIILEDAGISPVSRSYSSVYVNWDTDYVAGGMRLRLSRRRPGQADELVWQQLASGRTGLQTGNVWNSYPLSAGDRLVFSIAVVPEPVGLSLLAFAVPTLAWGLRRARR